MVSYLPSKFWWAEEVNRKYWLLWSPVIIHRMVDLRKIIYKAELSIILISSIWKLRH